MMENTEKKIQLKKRKKSKAEIIFICAMLAWPLLHFFVFWLYVNANTFYLTFFRFDTAHGGYNWIGLERFGDILNSIFVNPDAQIIAGKIKFKQYISPYVPAKVIENDLEYDVSAIRTALFGTGGEE